MENEKILEICKVIYQEGTPEDAASYARECENILKNKPDNFVQNVYFILKNIHLQKITYSYYVTRYQLDIIVQEGANLLTSRIFELSTDAKTVVLKSLLENDSPYFKLALCAPEAALRFQYYCLSLPSEKQKDLQKRILTTEFLRFAKISPFFTCKLIQKMIKNESHIWDLQLKASKFFKDRDVSSFLEALV